MILENGINYLYFFFFKLILCIVAIFVLIHALICAHSCFDLIWLLLLMCIFAALEFSTVYNRSSWMMLLRYIPIYTLSKLYKIHVYVLD